MSRFFMVFAGGPSVEPVVLGSYDTMHEAFTYVIDELLDCIRKVKLYEIKRNGKPRYSEEDVSAYYNLQETLTAMKTIDTDDNPVSEPLSCTLGKGEDRIVITVDKDDFGFYPYGGLSYVWCIRIIDLVD